MGGGGEGEKVRSDTRSRRTPVPATCRPCKILENFSPKKKKTLFYAHFLIEKEEEEKEKGNWEVKGRPMGRKKNFGYRPL